VRRAARAGLAVAIVATAVGAGWWIATGAAAGHGGNQGDSTRDADPAAAQATAIVERQTLTATDSLDGTLGYDGDYKVPGGLAGTLTWIVPSGTVVATGEPLYEVDGTRKAFLMYGRRPAWRTLAPGVSNGNDVRQLEENLLLLGFTRKGDEIDRHWDSDTTAAVKRWQREHGQTADGVVELGEVVFLPEAIRVTEATEAPGNRVGGGGALLSATSNRRVVSVDLAADERDLVDVGAPVSVELPDGSTIDGTVAEIGRVAASSSDGQGVTSTTLPVTITLVDEEAGADLDAAPVDVSVITESRENVLAVPVGALLALIEGGYAV
jgi:peptidoglycan hydrolase-like protein with peptidoglycan-binding domain